MIISFAWTTPALLAGRKTVTRREWDEDHAAKFTPGMLVDAYDKSPRFGGKKVATIRIQSVTLEATCFIPESDWEAEGFAYLTEKGLFKNDHRPIDIWDDWKSVGRNVWVVRFALEELVS